MSQFLPRGYKLPSEKRIRKPVAEGQNWQIYLTNVDSYALVVKSGLYEKWVSNYSLPKGLLSDSNSSDYKVLESSGDYLISSLEKGPFPDNAGQIEAFSIAFKTALGLFPTSDFYGAIYIEEYSLLLPSFFDEKTHDNGVIFGKWITGGIGISICFLDRVSSIMSWLPKESLIRSAQFAGFDITDIEEEKKEKGSAAEISDYNEMVSEPT